MILKPIWGMTGEYIFKAGDISYRAEYRPVPLKDGSMLMAFYVTDVTELEQMRAELAAAQTVLAYIQIDNYDEALQSLVEAERSTLSSTVTNMLDSWAKELGFLIQRLNEDGRGLLLGQFGAEDKILAIFKNGTYYTTSFDLSNRYQGDVLRIEKLDEGKTYTALYWDGAAKAFYIKRFGFTISDNTPLSFISDARGSYLVAIADDLHPQVLVTFGGKYEHREPEVIDAESYIAKKGLAAKGKKCHAYDLKSVEFTEPLHKPEDDALPEEEGTPMPEDVEVDNEGVEEIGDDEAIDIVDIPEEPAVEAPTLMEEPEEPAPKKEPAAKPKKKWTTFRTTSPTSSTYDPGTDRDDGLREKQYGKGAGRAAGVAFPGPGHRHRSPARAQHPGYLQKRRRSRFPPDGSGGTDGPAEGAAEGLRPRPGRRDHPHPGLRRPGPREHNMLVSAHLRPRPGRTPAGPGGFKAAPSDARRAPHPHPDASGRP